jgi:osmoprotectant transport system ATP-binding protein
MDAMIRLENLTKQYVGQAEVAVDDVSMEIPEGEIVVLVGPSGCGKTTTLKMINRLIEPSSGRIFLGGEDVTEVNSDQLRRRIGYVIQQIGLFPHQTIKDNIAVVPRMLGWDKVKISARVDELLALVGLARKLRHRPDQLSAAGPVAEHLHCRGTGFLDRRTDGRQRRRHHPARSHEQHA